MSKLTPEIQEAAAKASSYLRGLVQEHGGYVSLKSRDRPHREEMVILAVQLEHHPAPPGQMGWHAGSAPDAYSQAIMTINLAALVHRDLAARLGDPSDPRNCQCVECYERRLREWGS